ncbi:MAG: hypothetical protein RL431_410 [Actinomycetota bacterium]
MSTPGNPRVVPEYTVTRHSDSMSFTVSGEAGSTFRVNNAEADEVKIYLFEHNLDFVDGANSSVNSGFISIGAYGFAVCRLLLNGSAPVVSRSGRLPLTGAIRTIVAPQTSTVFFHPNGGAGDMPAQTAHADSTLDANGYSRPGFAFAGWNTRADGSGQRFGNRSQFPFNADSFLYAQWRAQPQNGDEWLVDAIEPSPNETIATFRYIARSGLSAIRRGLSGQ